MGEAKQVSNPEGEVHRSRILRQAIYITLGAAYLAGAQAARRKARADSEVSNEGAVDPQGSGGVDRQL